MQKPASHAWLTAVVLLTERCHSFPSPVHQLDRITSQNACLLAGLVAVDGSTLSPHFEGFFWHCDVTRLFDFLWL